MPISLVDAHNPDFARYPRFEQAAAAAQVAELEAGDAIFIPYMWWHSVRSLDPFNILVNYWWNAVRGDPAAHIARERRGLLGSLSPEQAAQFTAVLAQLLSGTR